MIKALLAGAAVTMALAATPVVAQSTFKDPGAPIGGPMAGPPMAMGPSGPAALPREPATPGEWAQVHRDWEQMSREWDQRQRSGMVPPGGSVGSPTPGTPMGRGPAYGGAGPDYPIAPAMPGRANGLQGLPDEPATPAERAEVRRDWNEMSREWDARSGGQLPPDITAPYRR